MSLKYALFDLDGTLTDSAPGIINSLKYALRKFGFPVPDGSSLFLRIGPPLDETFRAFGFPENEISNAITVYREYYEQKGIFESSVYNGIPEELVKLRERGIVTAVATSKPEFYAKLIADKFGISGLFTFIGGANLDETRTVKSEVIAYVLESLGANPSETVMIGDRRHDINGAKTNKVISAGVLYGYGKEAEITAANPDIIIPRVSDIELMLRF